MELSKAMIAATAVKVNGSLAGKYRLVDNGFQAEWSNGASCTYVGDSINDAKYYDGTFIISNDVVEFFTLTPLNPTH